MEIYVTRQVETPLGARSHIGDDLYTSHMPLEPIVI
jgi:hypothetical protein